MIEAITQNTSRVEQVIEDWNYSTKKWYAVYTIVRHEKAVNSTLAEKNIETFLPLREVMSQWKDRRKRVQFPLFPGYLFVNISLEERWDVLNTRGAIRILGVNGSPVPVPGEQIEAIKRLLDSNEKYEPYPYFAEGREVLIMNGPFQGIRGRALETRGKHKLILSVDIIQRSVAFTVDIRDIELA